MGAIFASLAAALLGLVATRSVRAFGVLQCRGKRCLESVMALCCWVVPLPERLRCFCGSDGRRKDSRMLASSPTRTGYLETSSRSRTKANTSF